MSGRGIRTALATGLALLAGVPAAHAATFPDGSSGPVPTREVDLSGRWGFQPAGREPTTIEVPGGGWYRQGFTDVGEATYSRRVTVPATPGTVKLELGAVNHEATLYVDGRKVGTQTTSFMPQHWDLTPFVRPGDTHELRLEVKGRLALGEGAGPESGAAGFGGPRYPVPTAADWCESLPQGIFRSARLRVYPTVRIEDAHVRPSVSDRTLSYDVWVANSGSRARKVRLGGSLRSWNGRDWRYPDVPAKTVGIGPHASRKVTIGPLPWRAGRDSYWWPNVPYRPGYRAQLHDLRLALGSPAAGKRSRVGVPAETSCLGRRRHAIPLNAPKGDTLRRVKVKTTGGARARVRRRGRRATLLLDLRRASLAGVSVHVRAVTARGKGIGVLRRYRICGGRPDPLAHGARYRFGFRETRQVGTTYELNGVRVNFRGDSLQGAQYDRIGRDGKKGDAFDTFPGFLSPSPGNGGWPQAVDNYQRLNYNVVRIHQEPASPYMLEVADEMGLMIIGETAIRGSESRQDFQRGRPNFVSHTRDLVVRDRNHASVLRWSQANEPDANGTDSVDFQEELYRTVMANDPTRPVSIDVTSKPYNEIKHPNFSTYQHYVDSDGKVAPGYTEDPHAREDRPYGRGEYVWPYNTSPQGFTWFATSTQRMRMKDAAEIRPYSLAGAWASVVPGARSKDFLTDGNSYPLYGEDNLPDPWSNHHVIRNQRGFNPTLVADVEYWDRHKLSDAAGDWPTPSQPTFLRAGQQATRTLVVFNDTFEGERVDVRWELRTGSPDGAVVDGGGFAAEIPLGGHVTRDIAVTPQGPGSRNYLVLSSSKRDGELFREDAQFFEVTP
jgi:hypothetical protein